MKITEQLLSIPPYISTSWENVSSLSVNSSGALEISLYDGSKVEISNLSGEALEQIFEFHAKSLDKPQRDLMPSSFGLTFDDNGVVLSGMENFTGMMQHDPNQSNAPNMPAEILAKITEMSKAIGIDEDTFNIPESEPHCNCPYCQISRAIHGIEKEPLHESQIEDEEVSKEELTFREWNIDQKNDKLYEVTNPFDSSEKYSVYLGDPIGCTCGRNNCEHILAVLKS